MRINTKKKKLLLAATLAIVASTSLTGCSTNSIDSASDESVTLQYAIWDKNQESAMQQIISEFQKEHKNVTVHTQLTPFQDYWTKLQTSMQGG